jgi:hypothetical protein
MLAYRRTKDHAFAERIRHPLRKLLRAAIESLLWSGVGRRQERR